MSLIFKFITLFLLSFVPVYFIINIIDKWLHLFSSIKLLIKTNKKLINLIVFIITIISITTINKYVNFNECQLGISLGIFYGIIFNII